MIVQHSAVTHRLLTYPRVPEQLSKDHQVSGVQRQTHVGCGDGEYSHAGLRGELKALTQLVSVYCRCGAIDTDETDVLGREETNRNLGLMSLSKK